MLMSLIKELIICLKFKVLKVEKYTCLLINVVIKNNLSKKYHTMAKTTR
jgi:hypothetical protein